MTHKQVKFGKGKRSRKVKPVEEEYEGGSAYRRAVLLSCDDVERMAVESSRARLINHLVSKSVDHSSREFASYYRGSTRYLEPPYSITSHTNGVPIPTVPQVIPAYPSLIQAPRWYPYSRSTSEQNSETDFTMNKKYKCKCENCTTLSCPGKKCNMFKPHRFKDNIMTFCDQCTMTRKVHDASCGRTPIPSTPKCSDVMLPGASSMVAVKDISGKAMVHQMCSPNYLPAPILKKSCTGQVYFECGKTNLKSEDEVVRDIEPLKEKSLKCLIRKEDAGTDYDSELLSRKNIYNEGISDVVAIKMPLSLQKVPSHPVCSKSSVSSDSDFDNYIPHAHRSESKYHRHCMKPALRDFYQDATESSKNLLMLPSPKVISKTCAIKSCRRCKQPLRSIKLPKRVLTSERVIDSCAEKRPRNKMPCRRK